jgi:ribonuclease HI
VPRVRPCTREHRDPSQKAGWGLVFLGKGGRSGPIRVVKRATTEECPSPPPVAIAREIWLICAVPEPAPSSLTVVYTDGACSGNPGPGGWAWGVEDGRFESGYVAHTTNQRMEITAAFEAVRALPGRLEVVSDSTYVVNCFKQRWYASWRTNGWRNSQNKPVANRDLWEPFIELALSRKVTFRWVKGHGTDLMNAWVDELAVQAAQTGQGQKGQRPLPTTRT